jgi:hypothetical protein
MKSAVVPAQITTVEDKVAGNLTLQQLFLLACPIFVNSALYAILPRPMHLNAFKLLLMAVIATVCLASAIRIKDRLVILWVITILRYRNRPRYYVYNKNDSYLRCELQPLKEVEQVDTVKKVDESAVDSLLRLTTAEKVRLEGLLTHPAANLQFMVNKKGGLHAIVTEVE